MLPFLVALTITAGLTAVAVALRLFSLITAAKIAAAFALFGVVTTLGTIAVGQYRYQQCVDAVKRACPKDACPLSYSGPFIPDCEERRVLQVAHDLSVRAA